MTGDPAVNNIPHRAGGIPAVRPAPERGFILTEMTETTEIDLKKLVFALLHRWWLVLGMALLGGAVALLITRFLITPMYAATVKLYVNNSIDTSVSTISSSDITASKSLVDTYITIIRSDTVLDEVLTLTGSAHTASSLNDLLTAGALNSTEVFHITVTAVDPAEATLLANAIADVAPKHLSDIVDGSSAKVVERAKLPTEPASPNVRRNIAVGALLALLAAAAAVVLAAVFDVHILAETDLRGLSDLPILGVISDFQTAGRPGYGYYAYRAGKSREKPKEETREKKPRENAKEKTGKEAAAK
jgi:capsular polysaccharide biosynthesis protein